MKVARAFLVFVGVTIASVFALPLKAEDTLSSGIQLEPRYGRTVSPAATTEADEIPDLDSI
jgi:hypothetical protein